MIRDRKSEKASKKQQTENAEPEQQTDKANPLLDYLYDKPKEIPFSKAFLVRWCKKACHLISYLFKSFEWAELEEPKRELPEPDQGANGALLERLGLKMYDEADSRIVAVQDKSQKILGFIGILIPIYTAFLVYASKNAGSLNRIIRVSLIVVVSVSIIATALSVFAALRSLSVRHYKTPFILMAFDPKKSEYLDISEARMGIEFMRYANHNQVQADHLTEFLRASQMFLGLAITMLVLAGGLLVISTFFVKT
jgi:hypothetical protein